MGFNGILWDFMGYYGVFFMNQIFVGHSELSGLNRMMG